MRLVFTLFGLLIFVKSYSQSKDLSVSEVVTSTLKKDVLFGNAQTWITKSFGDYKSVVQFENKDQGKLILKGTSKLTDRFHPLFKYIIEIQVKDSKYMYSVSDINICSGIDICRDMYFSDDRLLEVIEEQSLAIDSMSLKDVKLLSKKELREFNEKLEKAKVSLGSDLFIRTEIKEKVKNICASLKEEMKKDSDF